MHGNAGDFTRGVQAPDHGVIVREDLGLDIGGDASHGVVRCREDRHEFGHRVNPEVGARELGDVRELGLDLFLGEMGEVEVDVVLVWTRAAPLAHLGHHRSRHHVAWGEILDRRGDPLHETLARGIAQDATLTAGSLGEEDTEPRETRGMELVELHILQGQAPPVGNGHAVTGQGVSVGCGLPHLAVSAGGEDDRLGVENVNLTGGEFVGDHTGGLLASLILNEEQVENVELVVKLDTLLDAVLVEGLQDHVAGAISGVAGAAYGGLAVVAGVPAKATLVDAAFRRAIEGQPHLLQVDDGIDGLLAHHLGGILVDQVVTALDGVEGVPLPVVFLDVGKSRAHAPLRRAGVTARRVELGEDRGVGPAGRLESRTHACPASADDDDIKLMRLHGAPSRLSGRR